jgi:hypothetical protein
MLIIYRGNSMTVLGSNNCESSGLDFTAEHVAISTANRDLTPKMPSADMIPANGQDKFVSRDKDGKNTCNFFEDLDVNLDMAHINVPMVKNVDRCLQTVINNTITSASVADDDGCAIERVTA